MTIKEKVLEYRRTHPAATRYETAMACGTTPGTVKQYFRDERQKSGIAPQPFNPPRKDLPKEQLDLKDRIKAALKKSDTQSISQLSDAMDSGVSKIRETVAELIAEGHTITIENDTVLFSTALPKSEARVLDIEKMSTGFYRFGVTGDNHLCSRYERMDVLNALYDQFERDGITTVFNTGNWIDGEARFNKHDLKIHGLDNQLNYWIENFPQRKGITTKYITGDDHEGWYTQREGINVGMYAELMAHKAGREDLVFLGHMESDIILKAKEGETKLRVLHPGGGSSYAISYTSQKIVESYSGGEKPDILLDGHFHKAGYNYIRGVHVVQTGCTEDQTPFMRKKKIQAHVGGWEIEFSTDDVGAVTRFKKEFFPFYDNHYYSRWAYLWN